MVFVIHIGILLLINDHLYYIPDNTFHIPDNKDLLNRAKFGAQCHVRGRLDGLCYSYWDFVIDQ